MKPTKDQLCHEMNTSFRSFIASPCPGVPALGRHRLKEQNVEIKTSPALLGCAGREYLNNRLRLEDSQYHVETCKLSDWLSHPDDVDDGIQPGGAQYEQNGTKVLNV